MNRVPYYPESTVALVAVAAANPETLASDGTQYAVIKNGTLFVLYRTEDSYYAVLSSSNPTTGTYYENYRKAVAGFEWVVLDNQSDEDG